jgi:hypothetical protein
MEAEGWEQIRAEEAGLFSGGVLIERLSEIRGKIHLGQLGTNSVWANRPQKNF